MLSNICTLSCWFSGSTDNSQHRHPLPPFHRMRYWHTTEPTKQQVFNVHVRKQLHYYYFLGRGSIMQLLKTDTLLDLLDLIQEYPSHHDMWSNPDAVDWKASVELKWTATLQGLQCTVKRPSIWVLSSGIRLHLLNLCLHIIEGQTASRCKESWNSTGPKHCRSFSSTKFVSK